MNSFASTGLVTGSDGSRGDSLPQIAVTSGDGQNQTFLVQVMAGGTGRLCEAAQYEGSNRVQALALFCREKSVFPLVFRVR
jgi:hypothetical protein